MCRRAVSIFLSLCMVVAALSVGLTANAATVNGGKFNIGKASGVPGDIVIVPITVTENPGIMAITISITYDSSVLKYESYYKGEIIGDYTVAAHPDKNIIRYVSCGRKDYTTNGTLASLVFSIKEDAPMGFYDIDIKYSPGDFCNWNLDKIMPQITSGGVEVLFNGSNCGHKSYSKWETAAEPYCDEKGSQQRKCSYCGHIELRDIDPIGHEYSDKWVIDKEATPQSEGIMSRHCIRCDKSVDSITYTLSQSTDGEIDNSLNAELPSTEFIEEIFKEQNPDKELTPNKPEIDQESSTPSQNKPTDNNQYDNENNNAIFSDDNFGETDLDEETYTAIKDVIDRMQELVPHSTIGTLLKVFQITLTVILGFSGYLIPVILFYIFI